MSFNSEQLARLQQIGQQLSTNDDEPTLAQIQEAHRAEEAAAAERAEERKRWIGKIRTTLVVINQLRADMYGQRGRADAFFDYIDDEVDACALRLARGADPQSLYNEVLAEAEELRQERSQQREYGYRRHGRRSY